MFRPGPLVLLAQLLSELRGQGAKTLTSGPLVVGVEPVSLGEQLARDFVDLGRARYAETEFAGLDAIPLDPGGGRNQLILGYRRSTKLAPEGDGGVQWLEDG